MLLTVEEGAAGGFGAVVMRYLADNGFLDTGLKVRTLTLPDHFIEHGQQAAMYHAAGLDGPGIVKTVLTTLGLDTRAASHA